MIMRLGLVSSIVVLLLAAGCEKPGVKPQQPAESGTFCHVIFKPDALGLDASIGLDTGGINGRQVAWNGKFVKLTDAWLVICRTDEDHETWIPVDNVLAFELVKPSAEQSK